MGMAALKQGNQRYLKTVARWVQSIFAGRPLPDGSYFPRNFSAPPHGGNMIMGVFLRSVNRRRGFFLFDQITGQSSVALMLGPLPL